MSEADRPTRLKYLRQLMRRRKFEDQRKFKISGDQLVLAPVPNPEVSSSTKAYMPALEGVWEIGNEDEATSPALKEAIIAEVRMGNGENSVSPALVDDKALTEKAHCATISKWNSNVGNETQKLSLLSRTISTTGDWAPSIRFLGTGNESMAL